MVWATVLPGMGYVNSFKCEFEFLEQMHTHQWQGFGWKSQVNIFRIRRKWVIH